MESEVNILKKFRASTWTGKAKIRKMFEKSGKRQGILKFCQMSGNLKMYKF